MNRKQFIKTALTAGISLSVFGPLIGGSRQSRMRVFILSGQSNCGGAGNGDLLPDEIKKIDKDAIMFSNWTRQEWAPLAPYKRVVEKFGIENKAFGPEVSFGFEMRKAYPKDSIAFIKQASGGTSVIAWDKNYERAGWIESMALAGHEKGGKGEKAPQYPLLLDLIIKGLKQLNEPYEIAGFLWFQAEADANHETTGAQWPQRVFDLQKNIATDVGFPEDIPFMIMDAHLPVQMNKTMYSEQLLKAFFEEQNSGKPLTKEQLYERSGLTNLSMSEFLKEFQKVTGRGPGILEKYAIITKMKKDIRQMAAKRKNTAVIEVWDLPTYEGVHFDTAGQLEIGKRLLSAYQSFK